MNEEIKAEWLTALRSGDYAQGNGRLRTAGDRFCCLGVLCDIAEKRGIVDSVLDEGRYRYGEDGTAYLPAEVAEWSGVPWQGVLSDEWQAYDLTVMNDKGVPFSMIADVIEGHA